MSVISQEKKLILVNSFNNIPFVRLYISKTDYDIFIYSKIKGALCLFINKDPNEQLFYLRIYDIKNYTMVFNIELKKEHFKYFTQYNDNFYILQLEGSLLGFKFNSIQSGKNFHNILKSDPNKDILEVNEKSMNIKPKEISKTIIKVNESIKTKLKTKFLANAKKGGGGFFSKKVENFPQMTINDKKGEILDLSNIPKIYNFLKIVEISDVLGKMIIFPEKKLSKNACQNYIKKYDDSFDFNNNKAPIKIIEKDFLNISNKEIYINILVNNMINDMKMHERQDIFKREHIKRTKKNAGYKLGWKKGIKTRKSKDFSIRLSRVSSDTSIIEAGYFSDSNNNDARTSISSNSGLSGLYNDNGSQPKQKKKDKYSEDRKSISEINTVALDNIIDSDDDNDNTEAGFKYFAEEKKKPVINQKKKSSQKTLTKSISSDYILGKQKDKSKKKSVKKAEEIMNFLGGDSVAIPEMDEDEGDNKNVYLNTKNSKDVKTDINYNFKNKINMSSKTSLTGFLMTTNKLGKNKK